MSTAAKRRLLSDYKKYQQEAHELGVLLKPRPDNMMIWEGIVFGPDDTEWEGAIL